MQQKHFLYILIALAAVFSTVACDDDDDKNKVDYTKYYGWRDQNTALSAQYIYDIRQMGDRAYFTDSIRSFSEPYAIPTVYRVLRSANEDSLRAINRWYTPYANSTLTARYTLFDTKSVMKFFEEHDMLTNQANRNDSALMNKCFGIGRTWGDPDYDLKADTLESALVKPFRDFTCQSVIAGWGDVLQHMHIGDRWLISIPWFLAYGQAGSGKTIQPYSNLYFMLELSDITYWGGTVSDVE